MTIPRVPWDLLPTERDTSIDRLVLEHSGLAWTFHTRDATGIRDLWVSEAFTTLTGYRAEDLLPNPIAVVSGPLTDQSVLDELLRLRKEDEVGTLDLQIYRADDTPFWTRMTICPVVPDPDSWLILHSDISRERERDRELAELVERQERAQARTRMLMGIFDNLANGPGPEFIHACLAELATPAVADWAGIYPASSPRRGWEPEISSAGSLPNAALQALKRTNASVIGNVLGADVPFAPLITPEWISRVDDPQASALARNLMGISLIAVPIRGIDASYGTLALASKRRGSFTSEDVELARVVATRLGLVFDGHVWQESNSASAELIETSVFLPPKSFARYDIAAESDPPLASDVVSGWCDAYPLPEGRAGFAISVLNAAGLAVLNTASMIRSTVRACLWKGYPPENILVQVTQLAYLSNSDPIPSSGIVTRLTRNPTSFHLDLASVAHLPSVVRIPGEGFRELEGTATGGLGTAAIPLLSGSYDLPYGSVLYFLTDSAFNDGHISTWGAIGRLNSEWESLPEDAPADAYAQVIRDRSSHHIVRRQQLCYMIVRVLEDEVETGGMLATPG